MKCVILTSSLAFPDAKDKVKVFKVKYSQNIGCYSSLQLNGSSDNITRVCVK